MGHFMNIGCIHPMQMFEASYVVAECLGKVMLCGGYLVLEGHPCVVIGTAGMFRTTIRPWDSPNSNILAVDFVQFLDGLVQFKIDLQDVDCKLKPL